tara:strand:+ start:2879 stop:3925 length:1047 start_codon:yes stop_codon:yes gene_type:complete
MQSNFVLTDLMKTGKHQEIEQFISSHSLPDQSFYLESQYYRLHNYDLDSYDRRFAIVDVRHDNHRLKDSVEFNTEMERRCELLHSQGFTFISATPWESLDNISKMQLHPEVKFPHVKWTGSVSWFWSHMYHKHKDKTFKFDHSKKNFDFLYLNKGHREHRVELFNKLSSMDFLQKSLYSYWPKKKLAKEYELPWAQDYPLYGMDQDIYEKPYNDTAYNIVSESNDNDHDVFMTEKIWKPIIAQQIFVVHGNYLYLQKLREMGFKTFGSYFDESYDIEKDAFKRIDKICLLCKDLMNKNWKDMYLQTIKLRQHNHDIFFNQEKLSEQINKTLNLFLEFADSSQVTSTES